jgi:hypothetical protein
MEFETQNPPATAPVTAAAAKSVSRFFDIGILLYLASFRIVRLFPSFVEQDPRIKRRYRGGDPLNL